jgi:ATP-binding cassette subfamily F protein 3
MPLLSATNIKYTIGTRVLLDGISFSVEAGERVGLVGRNGCGKTTFIRMLAGRQKPDSGSVSLAKGMRLGYLSQDPELDPAKTLQEEAASGFAEILRLHAELDQVFHDMAEPANADPDKLQRLMDRQSELQERIESMGGYATEHRVEAVLHGLGFVDAQFGIPVSGLSGGQKGRLALAKLLLESPDIMLLDEPTNHLDIVGREWLEEYLVNDYRGAVIMISHDRQMLDNVVGRIEEIDGARMIDYPGNYTAFRDIRKQRLLTQHRAYENQQSVWAKEEEFIRRFRAGQRAKEAQGRLSKLERQKELFSIERPAEMGAMKLRLPEAPRSADLVAVVRDAAKVYPARPGDSGAEDGGSGERVLFHDLTVTINRGERWAIVGPNGAGKTTLVRAMLGELPLTSGSTRIGASVVIGYYAQLPPGADDELPVWEYLQRQIKNENPGLGFSEQQARDLAGAFLFAGREQDKQLKVMSGGERSRARLAALLASAKNLLVLDEPTNHLDIPSAERLEEALRQDEEGGGFGGTLILISHDRALIDATCDHLIVLDGHGGAAIFKGNYSQWHAKQLAGGHQKASWAESDVPKLKPAAKPAAKPVPQPASSAQRSSRGQQSSGGSGGGGGGLSWMSQDKLEKEIEKANIRLKKADAELARDEVYRDAEKFRLALSERDEAAAECDRLEQEWLRRADGT